MPRIRPEVCDGVSESVFRTRGNYYREKYFWIDRHEIPKWVGSSRWKETALWSEHDEDIRDKMQEASASADIPLGCLPRMRGKMQLLSRGIAGWHLCNNPTVTILIVLLFEFKKTLIKNLEKL